MAWLFVLCIFLGGKPPGLTSSMKLTVPFLAVSMCCVTALAADLTLTDGRVLKDAAIVSQAPRTVTIRHAAGLSSIAKTLLPPELKTKYPVDESAALVADQKAAEARLAAQEFQKREAARAAAVRAPKMPAQETSTIEETENARIKAVMAKAKAAALAAEYFKQSYPSTTGTTSCYVSIAEFQPVENWPNHWHVVGRATISQGYTSTSASTSQIGDPSWRENYNRNQSEYQDRAYNNPERSTMTDPEWRRRNNWEEPSSRSSGSSETKDFEAYYSTEGATPTIDVRPR